MTSENCSFVLIHGGSFNARYWDFVSPMLDDPVLAVDLPSRSSKPPDINALRIQDWVDSVVADVLERDLSNIVLAGHSLVGITMLGVSAAISDRIKHIVYSSCTVPTEGEKVASILREDIEDFMRTLEPAIRSGALTLDQTVEDQSAILNTVELIGENPDQALLDVVCDPSRRSYPEALTVIFEIFSWRGYPRHTPSIYIKNMGDILVPPKLQDKMIANIGEPRVVETPHPHCVELVAPKLVAEILNGIAAD